MEKYCNTEPPHRLTQHIRIGLKPLPFGTLFPSVATSYMLETLSEMAGLIKRGYNEQSKSKF